MISALQDKSCRVRSLTFNAVYFFVKRRRHFTGAILVKPRVTGITDNGEQPGAAINAVKRVKKLKRAQIGILNHILRILFIAREPPG
jgi:hypothetical protein